MSSPDAAQHYKEVLIAYCTRLYDLDYFDHFNISNFANHFTFDSDLINIDGVHALSQLDPTWTLDSVSSRATEKDEDSKRLEALKKALGPLIQQPQLAAEVGRLLDQDLNESDRPKELWGKSMMQKGCTLALFRAEKAGNRLSDEFKKNLSKYQFEVVLMRLRYGYADITDDVRLLFNYNTPFHAFLSTLREQTMLCSIPPRDLSKEDSIFVKSRSMTRETSKTLSMHGQEEEEEEAGIRSESENINSNVDDVPPQPQAYEMETQTSKAKKYQGGGKPNSATQNNTTSEESRRPRSPSEKGYTLNDGPWRYKILSKKKQAPIFLDISKEGDYKAMLYKLKDQGNGGPEPEKVMVMHSMDRAAWETMNKKRVAEAKENGWQMERLREDPKHDPDWEGDNNGETFSTWWLRDAKARDGRKTSTSPSRTSSFGRMTSMSSSPPQKLSETSSPAGMSKHTFSPPAVIND